MNDLSRIFVLLYGTKKEPASPQCGRLPWLLASAQYCDFQRGHAVLLRPLAFPDATAWSGSGMFRRQRASQE